MTDPYEIDRCRRAWRTPDTKANRKRFDTFSHEEKDRIRQAVDALSEGRPDGTRQVAHLWTAALDAAEARRRAWLPV